MKRDVTGFLISVLACILLMILISSCSGDDPTDPTSSSAVTVTVGEDGGILTLENRIHLYVPAGTVSSSTDFALEEVLSPHAAPDGYIQVGPAFTATSHSSTGDNLMALAVEFDYSYLGELSGKMVRLSRLDATGQWQPILGQGTSFPLGLGVTVSKLGTFAAHVDTSIGAPADVLAHLSLNSKSEIERPGSSVLWSTRAGAEFWNFDQTEQLVDTGGSVSMGDFVLEEYDHRFFFFSAQQELIPGSSHLLEVPGGAEVPPLVHNLVYLDADLVLTNPPEQGTFVSRHEPYTITWDGAGPQLVWLAVYGTGVQGSFSFNGKMRPNTGELILSPEDLAMFGEGATVQIFLQRTQARYFFQVGFHRASFAFIAGASIMDVTMQ